MQIARSVLAAIRRHLIAAYPAGEGGFLVGAPARRRSGLVEDERAWELTDDRGRLVEHAIRVEEQ